MIQKIELLNQWFFNLNYAEGMEKSLPDSSFTEVQLPHTNVELPYNYFDEKAFQVVSCYKKYFATPDLKANHIVTIRFEGVMTYAKVYLNGTYLGDHKGGYTPFEFEIQHLLSKDSDNLLTVVVDATERPDIPPFGGQIDYLTYGGIYREVSLDIYDAVFIENAHIITTHTLDDVKGLEIHGFLMNTSDAQQGNLEVQLTDASGTLCHASVHPVTLKSGASEAIITVDGLTDLSLWSTVSPTLYTVQLTLQTDTTSDRFTTRIGFRTAEFKADGFYLNNEKVQIRGLNRHQSWPYVGYAMPKRGQIKDADLLKFDLNLNLVRTSHYPQSIHFLNRCDEIGLLVFEEIPGWQHIGDEAWKLVAIENVAEMIQRDWNHASIILWGVRINESMDDTSFYSRTNSLAHALDQTRQTGGVRYIENSELLEDVYTMNDFAHSGGDIVLREQQAVTGLDHHVPYMVTEYNGHMYPTKKFDSEERHAEHVLRHVRVQNAAYANPWISGAIGWCAFDYNTHKDFGAGDRICYHGIMDMFRIKKFAAYVYKSQVAPSVEAVLQPVTYWARGERSIGGVLPLIVLTNCDTLTIQFGQSEPIPVTKKSELYSALPYPPFIIDMDIIPPSKLGEWGMKWEDGLLVGYVDGKEVASYHMSKEPVPSSLSVVCDDLTLDQGAKDATRVIVTALDQKGITLPFIDAIVKVTLTGPGRIPGPAEFTLKGGSFGFYIESNGQPGAITVTVESSGFETQIVEVVVQ